MDVQTSYTRLDIPRRFTRYLRLTRNDSLTQKYNNHSRSIYREIISFTANHTPVCD